MKKYPIVVMKLGVNESSENRKRRQLFPTPKQKKKGNIFNGCRSYFY
jgi:hypothetical protein